MSTSLHLHPDMKTHTDRPLVVENKDSDKISSGGPEEPAGPRHHGLGDGVHVHSRRHHRHRDKSGEGGDGRGGRHHAHHRKEHNSDAESHEGRHQHHQAGSPERDGSNVQGGAEERSHRHHHSHRTPRDGNGRLVNGAQEESRGRGENNGERQIRYSRLAKAQSTLTGDDCRRNKNGSRSCRYVSKPQVLLPLLVCPNSSLIPPATILKQNYFIPLGRGRQKLRRTASLAVHYSQRGAV